MYGIPSNLNLSDMDISPEKASSQLPDAILEAISAYTDKRKKPKRNRSAFILFSIDVRKNSKHGNLDELNPNDKFVKIAQLWKKLGEEERKYYEEKAKKEKERYTLELNDFCKIFPSEPIQRPRNHIKKPCNAYGYFLKEMKESLRKENPNLRMCEILRIVGEKWKYVTPAEKEKFDRKAEESRKIFKDEINKQTHTLLKKKAKLQDDLAVIPRDKEISEHQQENLVCKDLLLQTLEMHEMPENPVSYEIPRKMSSNSDKENILKNLNQLNIPNQQLEYGDPNISNPCSRQEVIRPFIRIPSFLPETQLSSYECNSSVVFELENLYWKVEKLRQQILIQLKMISNGQNPSMTHFEGLPMIRQEFSNLIQERKNNTVFWSNELQKQEEF